MTSQELRQKFLNFFQRNNHVIIPSAPLVPSDEEQLEGKEKVLFTSAGMQPLIPYLMGRPHPRGDRLADVQKCVRTDDIEEVGDATHHTFFEMLGNWSLGAYWKEEAIELSFKFLTEELNIPLEKLAISVFTGDDDAPRDEVSANKWKELGISEERIAYLGKEHNWWPTSRRDPVTGELKNAFGPCGPDTEMFVWVGGGLAPEKFDPKDLKWVEVWNDVFMEFNRKADGTLEELPQKNVDTGMGLERALAVINGKDHDYETDLFDDLYQGLRKKIKVNYNNNAEERIRIFLDNSRAVIFLMADGVKPETSQKQRDSVLKRLIRAATDQITLLFADFSHTQGKIWWQKSFEHFKKVYEGVYFFNPEILEIIKNELKNYGEDIYSNEQKVENLIKDNPVASGYIFSQNAQKYLGPIDVNSWMTGNRFNSLPSVAAGSVAFDAKATLGFPVEGTPGTVSIAENKLGQDFNRSEFNKTLEIFSRAHQQISKGIEKGMFKGGLADHSEIVTKYHTATHLLHQALRDVLGPQVFQKGSNITSERLRFDFSFDRKMTEEEIKQAEEIINKIVGQDLKVDHMIVNLEEAKKMNAIGLFNEKYADKVSIYGVGPNFKPDPKAKDTRVRGGYYSLEFCGGPHVEHTSIIGKIKIAKEEAVSSGIRRIRMTGG